MGVFGLFCVDSEVLLLKSIFKSLILKDFFLVVVVARKQCAGFQGLGALPKNDFTPWAYILY